MTALATQAIEGDVIDTDDAPVTDDDRLAAFLHAHQATCTDYWCSRGIDSCITIVPNTSA